MKFKLVHILAVMLLITAISCSPSTKKEKKPQQEKGQTTAQNGKKTDFSGLLPAIVKVESFDKGRFLESETGFFVGNDLIVCRLSMLNNATHARISPLNKTKSYKVSGFVAVDRINDLVLLKVEGINCKPVLLYHGIAPQSSKTIYLTKLQNNTLPLHRGKVLGYSTVGGVKRYKISNQFHSKTFGTPVFLSNQQAIGLGYSEVVDYENQHFVIPSTFIAELLQKKKTSPEKLENLRTSTNKAIAEANSKIKGLLITTDMGNIKIRLFNETPEYRDNFIRLVRENYYDSLLIHRVIKGFCIQSGAADTRYAGPDDIVGWKGPGYSIPAHIVQGFYHKRGMIGSPRKPDRGNSKRRSDGS